MNIKIGILNVPKHCNKHDLIYFVTQHPYLANCWKIFSMDDWRRFWKVYANVF